MKKLINSLAIFMLTVVGMTTFSSCDPCATVVCTNGTCNTGACSCNAGYEKIGANCTAINLRYGNGVTAVSELAVFNPTSTTISNGIVNYTISPKSGSLYSFTIEDFLGVADNDVDFTISNTNPDVITSTNVITTAGHSYTLSGSKTGTQVQLQLYRPATSVTYTLTYSVQ